MMNCSRSRGGITLCGRSKQPLRRRRERSRSWKGKHLKRSPGLDAVVLKTILVLEEGGDALKSEIDELIPGMVAVRRDLHEHPELAFQEVRTSNLVAQRLRALGLDVQTGVAKTGVVGTYAQLCARTTES